MKNIILLILSCTILFSCITGCVNADSTEMENKGSDSYLIGGTDHFEHPIFLDTSTKYTSKTPNEKLNILNDLNNQEIVSAFLFINDGGWHSVEIDTIKSPNILTELKNTLLSPENEYTLFDGDVEDLGEYSAYIIFTDLNDTKYVLFILDYNIITDEVIGTFSNGEPLYATLPASVIIYDGDYFLLANLNVWQYIAQLPIVYTEDYSPNSN